MHPSIETQLAVLNTKLDLILERLGGIDKRLDGMDQEQDTIHERLTEHSIKFARAEGAAAVPRSIGAGDDSTAIVLDPSAPAGALRRPAVIAAAGTAGGLGTLLFLLIRYLFGL